MPFSDHNLVNLGIKDQKFICTTKRITKQINFFLKVLPLEKYRILSRISMGAKNK